jgi:4-hydroxybenzoate polyprenyltransferase
MVWNDYFDIEQDRHERPGRPLPSGRVARSAAARFGMGLVLVGLLFAAFAGWQAGGWCSTPLLLAGLLVLCIFLYDRCLKRTWAGPLGMGLCRFLNVLLGFAVILGLLRWGFLPAAVVGTYIVGVTWFARTEARQSNRTALTGAAAIMLFALLLALPVPALLPRGTASPWFPYLLVVLGFLIGVPASRAIAQPVPRRVQTAVKRAIFGLIVLDAVLAAAFAGSMGLVLLVLLLPALYLGRWIYST